MVVRLCCNVLLCIRLLLVVYVLWISGVVVVICVLSMCVCMSRLFSLGMKCWCVFGLIIICWNVCLRFVNVMCMFLWVRW